MAPSSPQGRVYGVSCPPTPARHPTQCQLLLLLLLLLLPLQVQGAALQKNTPYSGRGACAGSIRPSPRVIFLNSARLTDT